MKKFWPAILFTGGETWSDLQEALSVRQQCGHLQRRKRSGNTVSGYPLFGLQRVFTECVPVGSAGAVSATNGKQPGVVFRIMMTVLWGPFVLLRAAFGVLGAVYRVLLGRWLDRLLNRRADERFCNELQNRLSYLFSRHPGKPVRSTRAEYRAPRSFDYSIASFKTDDLMLRFTKVRGEYRAYVAPLVDQTGLRKRIQC